jgi:hypothetical protein
VQARTLERDMSNNLEVSKDKKDEIKLQLQPPDAEKGESEDEDFLTTTINVSKEVRQVQERY